MGVAEVTSRVDASSRGWPHDRKIIAQRAFGERLLSETGAKAGASDYMARVVVQAIIPRSAHPDNEFSRSNGRLHVSILAPAEVGLPFGCYPRLLLAWLTIEAVRTKSPTLCLGDSLSDFMEKLGLLPVGATWDMIPHLRDQARRLFGSSVIAYESLEGARGRIRSRGERISVADEWDLWWDTSKAAEQASSCRSWVRLSDAYFQQITERDVPLDLAAIRALKNSSLALDLYAWARYQVGYLSHRAEIPWEALQMQFGADNPGTPTGRCESKKDILGAVRKVAEVYAIFRASERKDGLCLLPSSPRFDRA